MKAVQKTFLAIGMMLLGLLCRGEVDQRQFVKIRGGLPHLSADSDRMFILTFGNRAYKAPNGIHQKNDLPFRVNQMWTSYAPPQAGALGISGCEFTYGNWNFLAILDTFVNDLGNDPRQVKFGLQAIWNRIPVAKDCLLVYSPPRGPVAPDTYMKTLEIYEDFAEKYDIPSIDLAGYLESLAAENNSSDPTTLNVNAASSIANAANDLLSLLFKYSLNQHLTPEEICDIEENRAKHKIPSLCSRVSYESDTYPEGWLPWQLSPVREPQHVLVGESTTTPYNFEFFGEAIGIVGISTPECGAFEFSIDDAPFQVIQPPVVSKGRGYYEYLLASNLTLGSKHTLRIKCVSAEQKLIIGYFLIANYRPPLAKYGLKYIDDVYAKIPQLAFVPEHSILEKLPLTKKRLEQGETLSILLLGDSIVNGIRQSDFELLIQAMYPNCKIKKQTSTRGSTGCWYYRQPENFPQYVGNKEFDLLMIGGISHLNDIEAIEDVVKQTLVAKPDAEVILMTDAWGTEQHLNFKDHCFDRPPSSSDQTYQGKLRKLAESFPERVAFMDITTPWAQYLRTCGAPYIVFKLDKVHGNIYGNQLLGRIIEAYFAPVGYDPLKEWEKRRER